MSMSAVETIKMEIERLPRRERARLASWVLQREEEDWDRQIAADFEAGKLDRLIRRARREARQGRLKDLP
jgi:hypothetical protein